MARAKTTGVLIAIALFKLVKAVVLIALGVAALLLLHRTDTWARLNEIVSAFRVDPDNRLVNRGLARISGLDTAQLEEVSVGTFTYAVVFLVEGTGLLLRKHWAEYVTAIVTASFIPL